MAKARFAATALVLFVFAGCEKDPADPQTWVDKLDDRKDLNEALRHLERMGDPHTVKPLGEAWKKQNKASNILRVLISVAGQKDAKTGKTGWTDALPYLEDAVDSWDVGSTRSIDDAVVACAALGRSEDPQVVPTLVAAAQKPLAPLSVGNHVRIACTRALGHFHDPKVASVLIQILETDPERQIIRLNAAAALALAESGDAKALPALINAMYFIPAIFQQVRQAVTRVGQPAVAELLALFQEKDADVARKAHDKNFEKTAPGNIVYKAALLLGDMRVQSAVPMLTAALKTEPRIAFYDPKSGAPGPTTHDGILGALRLIMDPASAPAVRAYAVDPKTYDGTRPTAIDVYSMIAPDDSAVGDLWKFAKDDKEEAAIRLAAIVAYGRLARSKDQERPLLDMAQSYDEKFKRADEKQKAATKDEEKAQLEDEKQAAAYWRDAANESVQRIEIAVECKQDPACYAKALPPTTKDFRVGGPGLPRAERALLELGKMGAGARGQTDALLAAADTTERFVRQGVLLALPRVAALPCPKCAERLDQIITKQADTTTLDFLTGETRIVYHYFLWAGK
jgi:hypothetical protein